jgi:hypothetical protein
MSIQFGLKTECDIVPQAEIEVNPHVGLTQSHDGRDMQDPPGSQIVQLQAVLPQQ